MGRVFAEIDTSLRSFIEAQQMFFVGTAPLSAAGHVNLSPKGLDSLRVLDTRTLAYLDHVGSGAETIAHLRENGRIIIMFCAFQGPPRILRLHGRGEAFEPIDVEYAPLRGMFPPVPTGRAIIRVSIDRISDSCGHGVPLYSFEAQRSLIPAWADRKGEDGLAEYQKLKNRESIDALPALRWVEQP